MLQDSEWGMVVMSVYMKAVELLTGPSLGLFNIYYLVQVCFFKTLVVKKNYKDRRSSTFFYTKQMCTQILIVINWSKLAFFGPQTWTS